MVRPSVLANERNRPGEVTAKDIAWCGQVDRGRREKWASAGRLKADAPFTEHDAVETAVAFSLARHGVSQKAATTAWELIRPEMQRLLLSGTVRVWAVVSADGPRAWVASDGESAARRAHLGGRCWVVDCSAAVAEARRRYAEVAIRRSSHSGELAMIDARRRRPERSVEEGSN